MSFRSSILTLIREVATKLPPDVLAALVTARNREAKASSAKLALEVILKNFALARDASRPLCQDTGTLNFFVTAPPEFWERIKTDLIFAVRDATKLGYLRPNAVDSLTNQNSGDNTGVDFPKIEFSLPEKKSTTIEIELLLKGGGSENISDQISLPLELPDFGAARRDLDGVKKAVLQIVKNARGYGCAPGILGVHIGGDRAGGYARAKKNLLVPLDAENPDPALAQLEAEILHSANQLGIGPMGFGGKTTLLGCRVSVSHRLPASFFVTVAYNCWALRRGKLRIKNKATSGHFVAGKNKASEELTNSRLTRTSARIPKGSLRDSEILNTPRIKRLQFPLSGKNVRELKVGDVVLLSGKIFTGRDRLHEYALTHKLNQDLRGSAIYHCGPVVTKNSKGEYQFLAAGPTTSIREEPFESEFIARTGVRAVIGKGGMGERTQKALRKYGAVYLHAIGGAAAFYADAVKKVGGVDYLEFGIPEAMWELEVEDFLAVVTMAGRNKE